MEADLICIIAVFFFLSWGVKNDVDYIAASFIRKKEDVNEIKSFLDAQLSVYQSPGHPRPLIISKIESTEGLQNFDSILAVSDGIMVSTRHAR